MSETVGNASPERVRQRPLAVRPKGIPIEAFVRIFRVPPELAGMRVDVFLSSQLRNTSRTRAKLIAEKGVFTLDGRRVRPSDRIRAEDHLAVWRAPLDEADEPLALPVVYEDEHLLVIDKPPMLTVHPTARHHRVTVIKLLQGERPNQFLSLIHRLDRETSGVLLVAKSKEADRAFKRVLEDRSIAEATRGASRAQSPPVRKTYLALTWGVPPSGLVDLPLDRDFSSTLRVKMKVAPPGTGLEARTHVEVLEAADGYALIACRLLTGRQHQIRVHLSAIGCPVVGDKLYGPDERLLARSADRQLDANDLARLELPRQALHAHRYELQHPLSGQFLDVSAPLPADLATFWEDKTFGKRIDGAPARR